MRDGIVRKLVYVLVLPLLLAACGDIVSGDEDAVPRVDALSFGTDTLRILNPGGAAQITARVYDQHGEAMEGVVDVEWGVEVDWALGLGDSLAYINATTAEGPDHLVASIRGYNHGVGAVWVEVDGVRASVPLRVGPPPPTNAIQGTAVIDGRTYRTVTIGGLEWLAENYVFPTPSGGWTGGPPFPIDLDPARLDEGTFHVPPPSNYVQLPAGWRIPQKAEWEALFEAVAGPFQTDPLALRRLGAVGAWPFETTDAIGFGLHPTGRANQRVQCFWDDAAPAEPSDTWYPAGEPNTWYWHDAYSPSVRRWRRITMEFRAEGRTAIMATDVDGVVHVHIPSSNKPYVTIGNAGYAWSSGSPGCVRFGGYFKRTLTMYRLVRDV